MIIINHHPGKKSLYLLFGDLGVWGDLALAGEERPAKPLRGLAGVFPLVRFATGLVVLGTRGETIGVALMVVVVVVIVVVLPTVLALLTVCRLKSAVV